MRRKWLLNMAAVLSGGIYIIDRFIYSINNIIFYISASLAGMLLVMYMFINKKNIFLKELWKSWNTAQKIVLLLMFIINIYILGEIDLFSNILYCIIYICMNYIGYILFLKTESENEK